MKIILDKETFEKLQATALERLTKNLSDEKEFDRFAKQIYQIAVKASIATLEEYEKLKQ